MGRGPVLTRALVNSAVVVAHFRQAGAGDEADITGAYDGGRAGAAPCTTLHPLRFVLLHQCHLRHSAHFEQEAHRTGRGGMLAR